MEEQKLGWGVKLMLVSWGPKEGPVIAQLDYPNTTKEVVKGIQDKLAAAGLELNK